MEPWEVMKAYEEGAEIEVKIKDGKWCVTRRPIWNWCDFTYRVKPEPKTIVDYVAIDGRVVRCLKGSEIEGTWKTLKYKVLSESVVA